MCSGLGGGGSQSPGTEQSHRDLRRCSEGQALRSPGRPIRCGLVLTVPFSPAVVAFFPDAAPESNTGGRAGVPGWNVGDRRRRRGYASAELWVWARD